MPSIIVVKSNISSPSIWTKWFDKAFDNTVAWEYDARMESYHSKDVYLTIREGTIAFEDMTENLFFGWNIEAWFKVAEQKDLTYGYYDMASLNAEFVHIQDGKCIRDCRYYGDEIETDVGDIPAFDDWESVCDYIDDYLLATN